MACPRAAISTNIADAVLAPYAIAKKLVRISKGKGKDSEALINIDDREDQHLMKDIIRKIGDVTGIDFSEYRRATIFRRTEKRMLVNNIYDLKEYRNILEQDENEVHTLYKEFLIGVTRFFRDQEAFTLLENRVISDIVQNKTPDEVIRVWVPGCSTGEEPYTIAIILMNFIEQYRHPVKFKIFATDLDRESITFASEGVYGETIESDVPATYLSKYFDKKKSSYTIKKIVREKIVFTVHEALSDPPFINLDLISCRNMLIYLNPSVQNNLLMNFQFALNKGGYLFLGPSENLGDLKDGFEVVSGRWNIFRSILEQKMLPIHRSYREVLHRIDHSNHEAGKRRYRAMDNPPSMKDVYSRILVKKHAPLSMFVNTDLDILYINGNFEEVLSFPQAVVKVNLLEMVGEEEGLFFKNGVRNALNSGGSNKYENMPFTKDGKQILADVLFERYQPNENKEEVILIEMMIRGRVEQVEGKVTSVDVNTYKDERLRTLQMEIEEIKIENRSLIQQLETTNEELQASNEELLSANEEMQSTNEELQSVNEELYTVNTELQSKINELVQVNDDIDNLLKSTEIGTIFLDNNLHIRKFTPAFKQQFDLVDSDIGRSITSFANSFNDPEIYNDINRVIEELEVYEREVRDSNRNYYLMRILPYKTKDNVVDGAVITFIDINDLKKLAREKEYLLKKYQALFENATDQILILDINGTVESANFLQAGRMKEEVIGIKFEQLVPEDSATEIADCVEAIRNGATSTNWSGKINLPNGNEIFIDASFSPITIEDKLTNIAIICKDVTAFKQSEQNLRNLSQNLEKQVAERSERLEKMNLELLEVNDYLDSFVNGAAHDLRAPIANVKGLLKLLPTLSEQKERKETLQQLDNSMNRLESVLNSLIELIDFQKKTDTLAKEVRIKSVYEEVINQLAPSIEEANASIQTDFQFDGSIKYIKAYLANIFYNLLTNSIKYRSYERDLHISVTIKQSAPFIQIIVKDNGIGMNLKQYGHFLFKPFKRLTVEREGSGIGLSIVNKIVKRHGGRIEVESNLGEGACFKILIKPLD